MSTMPQTWAVPVLSIDPFYGLGQGRQEGLGHLLGSVIHEGVWRSRSSDQDARATVHRDQDGAFLGLQSSQGGLGRAGVCRERRQSGGGDPRLGDIDTVGEGAGVTLAGRFRPTPGATFLALALLGAAQHEPPAAVVGDRIFQAVLAAHLPHADGDAGVGAVGRCRGVRHAEVRPRAQAKGHA